MGCFLSKDDTHASSRHETQVLSPIQANKHCEDRPPAYSISKQTPQTSLCNLELFMEFWMSHLPRAQEMQYQVWVNEQGFQGPAGETHLQILKIMFEHVKDHDIDVRIKCLDFLKPEENPTSAYLLNIFQQRTKAEILDYLSYKPDGVLPQPRLENLQKVITDTPDISDQTINGMVIAQRRDVVASLKSREGGKPTVFINFVPSEITQTSFENIKSEVSAITSTLKVRGRDVISKQKQDLMSFQFVAIGNKSNKSPWRQLDDAQKGRLDFIDHTHIDPYKFRQQGAGTGFVSKTMLGSIDPDLDRNSGVQLYGTGSGAMICKCPKCGRDTV
ncbi:hypothetical protein GQ44DRAFT_759995 [Phaeosphaeriaceae sp. PMI808]|nr:hypothetical protein GQ44DRAFT_759995 [Phaeosphaeriaceae sp. PMI808]